MTRTLSHDEAKDFYDWFGARQDSQRFYEDAGLADLIRHAEFDRARSVFEFGCGTGRFADRLLSDLLPAECRYRAIDVSTTMVRLARARLARWGERASVERTSGSVALAVPDASVDRFVATYVLDVLSEQDIRGVLAEAHRVLAPGGLLCNMSLTRGATLPARIVGAVWQTLFRARPKLVGGCRPIVVRDLLGESDWSVRYVNVVTRFAISSEVLIAEVKKDGGDES